MLSILYLPLSLAERVKEGMAYAKGHGTKSGRPIGRPKAEADFMTISDALRSHVGEHGAVARVAREHGVSRAWLFPRKPSPAILSPSLLGKLFDGDHVCLGDDVHV